MICVCSWLISDHKKLNDWIDQIDAKLEAFSVDNPFIVGLYFV